MSFGCRLNALESEKIQKMLTDILDTAIVVNTCAVTAEAERQSGQSVRRLSRENPNAPILLQDVRQHATRHCFIIFQTQLLSQTQTKCIQMRI